MDNRINEISIRGRVAYLIMCAESYIVAKYPNRDWSPVVESMWKICDKSDYIDNSAYRYLEIIPECLYDRESFSVSKFDYLSETEYNTFISLIPKDDEDLNCLMHSIYDVAIEYAYCGIPKGAPDTIPYIEDVEQILHDSGLALPDVSLLSGYVDPEDWWGDPFDGRYLSIILNQNK